MARNSTIEWTQVTWNPVVGCSKVSEGCRHCYAETMSRRLAGMARADLAAGRNPGRKRHYMNVIDPRTGGWNRKVALVDEALEDPRRWRQPSIVFVNSMSDLFHADVPLDYIQRVFAVMNECSRHTFRFSPSGRRSPRTTRRCSTGPPTSGSVRVSRTRWSPTASATS